LVVFLHAGSFGGFTEDQAFVFVGAVFVSDAIYMTFFSNNIWMLPFAINRGELDYYLTRPVSPLFFLSLREFAANSFLNLLMAIGILVWALVRYPDPLGAAAIVGFVALLLVGSFVNYVFSMLFTIPVFWMHSGQGVRQIWFSLGSWTHRPHGIFPNWLQRLLTSLLPLALVCSLPTYALFEGMSWGTAGHFAAVVIVATLVLRFAWMRGLKAYSSASS
jgi:ABC-2 type transport system permease protein